MLKQQGHDHAATCCAWSPDGRLCISGADDRKGEGLERLQRILFLRTFSDHQAPVTAVACARNVVFSASRDGTVRAYDLRRYRQFRVFKAPPPRAASNVSSTSEPARAPRVSDRRRGRRASMCRRRRAVRCACLVGKIGPTARRARGHEGPVCALALDPRGGGGLASGSWDKTVRLWRVYRNELEETLEHNAEVLSVAYRRTAGN